MAASRWVAVLMSFAVTAITGLTLFFQAQPPPAPKQSSIEDVSPIFQRLTAEIAKHPRESVTHLEVTSFAHVDTENLVSRPEWSFDNDMPLSMLTHLSPNGGCAVEVAPILVLSCGCCEDTPYNVDFDDDDLATVARLPDIRWFRMQRVQASPQNLDLLAHQPQLEVLDVRENKLSDRALKAIGQLRHLKHLDLSHNNIRGAGLRYLSGLTRLETLILSNNSLTDEGLRNLPRLPALKTLVLERMPLYGASLDVLSRCPALQTLKMSATCVTGSGLCRLPRLAHLRELFLEGTRASSVCARNLAGLPSLQQLSLYQSRFSDTGLRDLQTASELRTLNLGQTRVTDEGMRYLAALPKLQALSLYGTAVTGNGLHELSESPTVRHIDILSMLDAPRRLTPDQLRELLDRFKSQSRLSIVLDAAADGSSIVEIAEMPNLRSLDIQLSGEVSRISLRDLPKLQDIRIRGLGDDSWYEFEKSPVPPRVRHLSFERVNPKLDIVWLTATELETDREMRGGRWSVTLHPGESFEEFQGKILPGYQVRVRTTEPAPPGGLSDLLSSIKPGGYFSLFCETPEWTHEWSDVLNAYRGKTFQAHIRCDRLSAPDALRLTGRIQHMHIENLSADDLTLFDAPQEMDELRLTNTGFGTLRMSGRHVMLNLNSVQRLDELHIKDLKKTYSVNLFDSISSPAYRPNRIRLTNCSQASFVSFRNVENVSQVIVEGDVPSEQFLRYMPAGIDVQFQ